MKVREQKKREKKKKTEEVRFEQKQMLERVLSALELLRGYRDLPASFRDKAVQSLPARPKVSVEPAARDNPDAQELKEQIERTLEERRVPVAEGRELAFSDFLSVCCLLPSGFASLTSAPLPQKQRLFAKSAAEATRAFLMKTMRVIKEDLPWLAMGWLMAYSRIDQQVFGCVAQDQPIRPGKPVLQLTVTQSEVREVPVEIDGKVRPAFECRLPWWLDGIRRMEADGAPFGLEPGRRYPVFIQPHALLRLRERLPGDALADMYINLGLLESLHELNVVEQQDDSYLIAHTQHGIRVGYLVAQVAEDKIVVKTFLFLTMKGTPEYRLLQEKLRLTRRDIEYEGLDRLETFMSPSVRADKDLVRVLEECGCGSLLALGQDEYPHSRTPNLAEELKRYLRLTKGGQKFTGRFTSPLRGVG